MLKPFDLSGKVAAVTGGGSGIGKAICEVLARHGAQVNVIDLNQQAAEVTASTDKHALAFGCNVAQQADVVNTINAILSKQPRIDILVNCAGIAHIGRLETTQEADLDKLYNVNIKGVYNTMYSVIPFMKKQQQGVIINLASVAAGLGLSDRFAYSMTKGAVVSMTLSVAKDYIHDGIRCNSISPGRVHTQFVDGFLKANYPGKEQEMFEKLSKTQPIGRMAKPEEVANLALYLCSDEAGFITGTDYPIDGGFIRLNT